MLNSDDQSDADDILIHCVCYLVSATLASYALTRSWSLPHLVESARLWQTRHGKSLDWLTRIKLGQIALRLCRERVKEGIACPPVQCLFTETLALKLESPVVTELWDRCREALGHR